MDQQLLKPRKDLEFIPVQDQGRDLIVIRDRFALVAKGFAIVPEVYHFLYLLDAVEDVHELQAELSRQSGGQRVTQEEIKHIIRNLDQAFLLDSEQFRSAREACKTRFVSQKTRPAALAGESYPAEPGALRKQLDGMLSGSVIQRQSGRDVKGIVAPHIDFSVGGKGYGEAYACIQEKRVDRVLVLGTGHQMEHGLYALTEKSFETVFGLLPVDRAAVLALKQSGGRLLSESDFEHLHEHSIEFQTLFLKHLEQKADLQMIPILCGSLWGFLPEYSRQAFLEAAGPFLESLRALASQEGVLVLAGVDFSHIGPKFGHQESAIQMESKAQEHDYALLAALCSHDPDTFWRISKEVNDCYNVCGFSALATFLEILPESKGELLHYEMWHEQATRSAVSFAAAAFSAL
jgi:hypothetical protein